ncbi:MAG TPA: DUF2339 domain-containing protein, partial [Pirellulales bacterium]|nr:DUF2339 domain-containing protein [Pirellulales bacterium]
VSLFTYLAVLNVGAVWLLLRRNWPLIGTVSLLGTQLLFWLWYGENYHPEKLSWALGFQVVIYGLYLLQSLLANLRSGRTASWEDLTRMLASAGLLSAAAYVLLDDDYRAWLGALAVAMAAVYAGLARLLLTARKRDDRLLLTAVAIAMGFLAFAFPLQADAPWVALGWAAEASVLWWAGVRIRSMPLRAMAGFLAVLAVGHILMIDTTGLPDRVGRPRPPFTLILNDYALPALVAVACLSAGLLGTRRRLNVLAATERTLVAIAAVVCVLLVWMIVSVDMWQYFDMLSVTSRYGTNWIRAGQMSLSAWWSVYAAIILAAGFRTRQAWLRWTALALFGLTVLKVFLFDMSGLDQIYRIVAFFVLALLLGIAAWAYQRVQPEPTVENSL